MAPPATLGLRVCDRERNASLQKLGLRVDLFECVRVALSLKPLKSLCLRGETDERLGMCVLFSTVQGCLGARVTANDLGVMKALLNEENRVFSHIFLVFRA